MMEKESMFDKTPIMCQIQCQVLFLGQVTLFSKEFQKAGSERLFNLRKVTQ